MRLQWLKAIMPITKRTLGFSQSATAENPFPRIQIISEAVKEVLASNIPGKNPLLDYALSKNPSDILELKKYIGHVSSKPTFLIAIHNLEKIDNSIDHSRAQTIISLLVEKLMELKTELSTFEKIQFGKQISRFGFSSGMVLKEIEDSILEDKGEILSLRQKAIPAVQTVLKIFQEGKKIHSEFFFELADMCRILHRENEISINQLINITKSFQKTGSCFGLSNLANQNTQFKKMQFGELCKIGSLFLKHQILNKEARSELLKLINKRMTAIINKEVA